MTINSFSIFLRGLKIRQDLPTYKNQDSHLHESQPEKEKVNPFMEDTTIYPYSFHHKCNKLGTITVSTHMGVR